MKKVKKYIIISIVVSAIIMPISFGIVAPEVAPATQIVSRGVSILLSCMQVLQYIVPCSFYVIRQIINKKKQNNKNTDKNILIDMLVSILIFILFVEIGRLILKNTSTYGYSSKTIDYIRYNGKIVYFHR